MWEWVQRINLRHGDWSQEEKVHRGQNVTKTGRWVQVELRVSATLGAGAQTRTPQAGLDGRWEEGTLGGQLSMFLTVQYLMDNFGTEKEGCFGGGGLPGKLGTRQGLKNNQGRHLPKPASGLRERRERGKKNVTHLPGAKVV